MLRPPACQGCTQPCNLFLTLVAGGKATTYSCCHQCQVLPKMMDGKLLPSQALGITLKIPGTRKKLQCPACGFRWTDFERIHRLGCPSCYQNHREYVLETIARIQPSQEHQGRKPTQPNERRLQLPKLRSLLEKAIKQEDYESAAALRDQIQALESEVPPAT